ncbi:MAG: hypothetical protein PHX54_07210 [Lentimicrobiaceae bacterium]|nr:hypothetical protein [Lentimicrobiaceae bacterium]
MGVCNRQPLAEGKVSSARRNPEGLIEDNLKEAIGKVLLRGNKNPIRRICWDKIGKEMINPWLLI